MSFICFSAGGGLGAERLFLDRLDLPQGQTAGRNWRAGLRYRPGFIASFQALLIFLRLILAWLLDSTFFLSFGASNFETIPDHYSEKKNKGRSPGKKAY